MSLFPAYTQTTCQDDHCEKVTNNEGLPTERNNQSQDLSWLKNTSYTPVNPEHEKKHNREDELPARSYSKSIDEVHLRNKRKKKKKDRPKHENSSRKDLKKLVVPLKILENDQFYEDKNLDKGNFLVSTLHRPAVPKYDKYNYYFKKYQYLKKQYKNVKKLRRYFNLASVKEGNNLEEGSSDTINKEEELMRVTEEFNRKLAENSNDINTWLEYVKFQDVVYEFENAYRKNPIGGERVTSERKISILERAIQSNPASEQLLAERLLLWENFRPADQLAEECMRELVQDPGNMALWCALVRTSRNNMARCTVPGVLQIFSKAITRVSQLRLHRPSVQVERNILFFLLECGLFLQQAGLWEQMWTLLQMYLSLSLTASGQFIIPVSVDEDKLRELEDEVVTSGLPLSVLWLRVEKLRAAYHFLPDTNSDSDPQRVVFTDDMAGLLQPVMSAELRLHVAVITIVLLKVPLLPTRHSVLQCTGLLDIPSAFNNVETILAAVYPCSFSSNCDCKYLSKALDLVTEPQFVKDQQGQKEYLSWVVSVMQHCAQLLPPDEAAVIHSWVLRLYRLMCRLNVLNVGAVPSAVQKQARSYAKQLLKIQEFKENLFLYTEYALIERDSGDVDKACKVLQTAAAIIPPPSQRQAGAELDVNHVVLCRQLVQCLLAKDPTTERENALHILMVLAGLQALSTSATVNESLVKSCIQWWQDHTAVLTEQVSPLLSKPLTLAAAMTPQLLVESLTCHALLLSITRSVWDATALLQTQIDSLPHLPNTLSSLWVEQLYEVLVGILYSHTVKTNTSFTVLRNTIVKALTYFPNNLSLLNTLAIIETSHSGGGTPLWKLVSFFPSSSSLARLILVFAVHYRVSSLHTEGAVVGGTNYLRNLLCTLTNERITGQCPLSWRLHLQLVAATDSAPCIKAAFYKCIGTCPWVKAFYMDAVKFLSEEMSEIQDLIIEKELRLHTTPEELDILRE